MGRNAWIKWLVLALALGFSFVTVWPPREKVRLGLDLQGGTSFTVRIDEERLRTNLLLEEPDLSREAIDRRVNEILKDADERALEVLRNRIDGLGINEPMIYSGRDNRIHIQLPGAGEEQQKLAEESIKSAAFLEFKLVHPENSRLTEQLFDAGLAPEGYRVVDIGPRRYYQRTEEYEELAKDPGYRRRLAEFETPDPAHAFMLQRVRLESGAEVYTPYFVRRRAAMTGENLERADTVVGTYGGYEVSLTFNPRGARDFARITDWFAPGGLQNRDSNRGRQLAIVMDGTLYSAPEIEEPIPGGRAVIRGQFTASEAAMLRNVLNAGSLPAPLTIIEKRAVSPTLGRDAIQGGLRAAIIGGGLVMLFMLVYYAYCGLIANAALVLNMLLLPAGMILAAGILGIFVRRGGVTPGVVQLPVLTLPGVAGILLTIGMAVDANVLIFERIREESELGKKLRAAVMAGYERATITIVDANVTTLLIALILFLFGSGPIRGFAITLSAGILVSMFTALVATKLFFESTVSESRTGHFRMLSIVKDKIDIDFVAMGRKALIGSVVVIAVAWGILLVRGFRNPADVLATDFTGGASMTFSFSQEDRPDLGEVRKALNEIDPNAMVQYQRDLDERAGVLVVNTAVTPSDDGQRVARRVEEALKNGLPGAGFRLEGEEEIGSRVSRELKSSAFKAMIFSFIVMILYISIRFEFGFALGAIAALLHDVLITVGLFSLTGKPFSLTIVAALLTIVGYSVNDTIVVFDRVREDLRLNPKRSFPELCNLSINQTLSRTILTSFTTLLALLALYLFGGGAINDFALALLIGVVAGTYSTIFIATPVVLAWHRGQRPRFAEKSG